MSGDPDFLGRGWEFPPVFGPKGADVGTASGEEDIHQSLRILLATLPGERAMAETFGCDLTSIVFAELDQGLASTIERLVRGAIRDHEPRIRVDRVDVTREDGESERLLIAIFYTVRATNSRFNMVFPFSRMEPSRSGT